MSKIGKKKIQIPKEVNVTINGDNVDIKGHKGDKRISLNSKLFELDISQNNNNISKW